MLTHKTQPARRHQRLLASAGIGVSIFAIIDNRRQRTQREKGVIAAQATFEHVYDLLIGIKPAGPLLPVVARGLQFVADLFSA